MHLVIAGIDIGSRAIKVVILENGALISYKIIESGFEPHKQAQSLINEYKPEIIIATGYGRHLAKKFFASDVITEIKAHAIGAKHYFPDCHTIIDVGGQDTKAISLNEKGNVVNFQMNDKCAAGTGRFLEIMAITLGYEITYFGQYALKAKGDVKIGSMCTVFAESEIITLKNSGLASEEIAKAVHISVVDRVVALASRVGLKDEIVFTGGVGNNPAILRFLEDKISAKISVPPNPEIIGALGAALYGNSL